MNRRQKRALAKLIPGYKKLLKEAKEETIKQFEEMMQKRWMEQELADGYIPADAASLNESIEKEGKKKEENLSNGAEITKENNNGTN